MEKDEYKNIISGLASGVCVVTSRYGDLINGMTATAISSVSAEPPSVMISVSRGYRTNKFIKESGVFTVNFLADDQVELSDIFAQPGEDKADYLDKISKESSENGCPIIEKTLGYLDCEVASSFEVADHTIFIGHPLNGSMNPDKKPLIYFSKSYYSI